MTSKKSAQILIIEWVKNETKSKNRPGTGQSRLAKFSQVFKLGVIFSQGQVNKVQTNQNTDSMLKLD